MIGKSAVFITVGDNVLCNCGIDACNPPQQCGRSGVQVNTDMVYGIFYGGIQTFFQFFLADVMLILSDADCLWIDFDELRERILHAAGNGDCAADCDIIGGEFLFRQLGGGVDGSARFVCDEVVHIFELIVTNQRRDKLLRLVGGCTVADGDERNAVCFDELLDRQRRCFALSFTLCNLYNTARENIACGVNNCHFAARTIAGIKTKNCMSRERRLKEQLAQVASEQLDGLFFGKFCQLCAQLTLERRNKKTFITVLNCRAQFC